MFQEFDEKDKSEDFLNDFRNKINSEGADSFQEKKEEINRSKNILVGAISGVVLAGVVGFIAFSPKFGDDANKDLPIIRRPQNAVKVQPMEPGGMQIANQDKSIYDVIEKNVEDVSDDVESILPPVEQPKAPEIKKASVEDIIAEAETKEKVVAVVEAPKPVKEVVEVETIKTVVEPKEVKVVKKEVAKPKKVISQEVVKAVVAKPVIAKPVNKTVKVVTKGKWQVQIMSSQNKNAIESSKASLSKKYVALNGVVLEIEDAIIAGKGTFYRLKAGAFETRDGADKLCAKLKEQGLSCFVKKN